MTKSIIRKVKHSSKRIQNNNPTTFNMESSSLSESVQLIENNETTSKVSTCTRQTRSKSKDKIISSKKKPAPVKKKIKSKGKKHNSKKSNNALQKVSTNYSCSSSNTSSANVIDSDFNKRVSARRQHQNTKKNNQFTSNNSNTWTYTYDKNDIVKHPVVNRKDLPKIMHRDFVDIPDLQRSILTHPYSDCVNYICRGRLLVLERLKALKILKTDDDDRRTVYLRDNDAQQIINQMHNNKIRSLYQFSNVMFIENIPSKEFSQDIERNNSLLINYPHKFYSSEEHATTNLCAPYVFRADTTHSTVPNARGIRASLQVQFECDYDKGIIPPTKPMTGIWPVVHDINDPLFKHLLTLTEKAIASRLKNPKEVQNFSANDFVSEWRVYDGNNGNEEFAKAIKDSYEYLRKKNKLTGTMTEWLYLYWNLNKDNVKDVRIIFIGGNIATGPHKDIGHMHSSNNSVTLHVNVWHSVDYVPGNTSSGPWINSSEAIYWLNLKGFIEGKFGELDCWYDKAEFKFIFGAELNHVRGKNNEGVCNWTKQPCDALMKRLRENIKTKKEWSLNIVPNNYVSKKKVKQSKKKEKKDSD